jgi:hypothetical protein
MPYQVELARRLDALCMEAMMGGPRPKSRPTALRVRGGRIEVVELDQAGQVIEPPATNCKAWIT